MRLCSPNRAASLATRSTSAVCQRNVETTRQLLFWTAPSSSGTDMKRRIVAVALSTIDLMKAGSDDLAEVLANFGEVEQHLRSLPCLHSMLVARGPVAFEADACREEIGSFSEAVASEVAATRASGRLELNASDCNVR